jgi:hypothetical protein
VLFLRNQQVFQNLEFPVDFHDKLMQLLNKVGKADVADAMTLLTSKQYSFFIFCGDIAFILNPVINRERKGRPM